MPRWTADELRLFQGRPWNKRDIATLIFEYSKPGGVDVDVLSQALCRTPVSIHCKADELGITSSRGHSPKTVKHRLSMSQAQTLRMTDPKVREQLSHATSEWIKTHGHPKGFLGHHRTQSEKQRIREGAKRYWADPTSKVNMPEYRQELSDRFSKLASKRSAENCYSRCGRGWRNIGNRRIFFRSRWEANYARLLEWQKIHEVIRDWEYEAETFWFTAIKRGCRSYCPDFRVTLTNGETEYHEVKGWMDSKSATKLKRMQIYYPSVRIYLRDRHWFKSYSARIISLIPDWER